MAAKTGTRDMRLVSFLPLDAYPFSRIYAVREHLTWKIQKLESQD